MELVGHICGINNFKGKEVVPEAIKILNQFAPEVEIIRLEAGFETFTKTGSAVPTATLEALK